MTKLIFGCGYLGRRVARRWLDAGHRVAAVTRNAARCDQLADDGIEPLVADVTLVETLAQIPLPSTVLYAVGHDRASGRSMRDDHVGGLSNVLAALARAAASQSAAPRIIYVSTTGVYGQNDDRWVDERAACEPATEGGRAHLAAEELLRSSPLAKGAIVLRMAGIYGPQRIPRRDDLAAGRPISAPREGYVNLIHVDDAADVVVAADVYASPPRTYQVSDGHPTQRRDYLAELARLIGAPPPLFVDSVVDPVVDSSADSRRERGAASKRISNARLLAELPVRLAYPSYRQGLAAIVGRG